MGTYRPWETVETEIRMFLTTPQLNISQEDYYHYSKTSHSCSRLTSTKPESTLATIHTIVTNTTTPPSFHTRQLRQPPVQNPKCKSSS